MIKLIDAVALSKFLSKINAKILTTKEQILANTNSRNIPSATATKELYDELNSNLNAICSYRQSNAGNIVNSNVPCDIKLFSTDESLFYPDAGGILITKPGIYLVQAHFHFLHQQHDTCTLKISTAVNNNYQVQNTETVYAPTTMQNLKQLTTIIRTSSEDRVLIEFGSVLGTSYVFRSAETDSNQILIKRLT